MSQETNTTRDGFGHGLVEAAQENPHIVGLCADLTESTRMNWFAESFPDRFVELGVAEQNLAGVAAGLALAGKHPVAASYAAFSPANNWGPIRASICYSDLPVTLIGGHAGISIGPDGATHQALEDIALMRVLPNMTVVVPADKEEARKAIKALTNLNHPSYLRITKYESPAVTDTTSEFTLGKANVLRTGSDVTLVACGTMVTVALAAAKMLADQHITARVINMHTIKPLDVAVLRDANTETNAIISVEEHQIAGGLGSAIAESLAKEPSRVPHLIMGIPDTFGQSGSATELLAAYGLTAENIVSQTTQLFSAQQS